MKKKLVTSLVVAASLGLLVTGCGKKKTEEPKSAETETVETQTETETVAGPTDRSYLTGEQIDESIASQRPIAIMIENTKMAVPQYGINRADVVYESPVEGSYTRLMGIYQDYSGFDRLGNVRSCRPYYAYFAMEFDAIYVHYGECMYATDILNSGKVDNLDGIEGKVDSLVFYRTSDKKQPHNAYVTTDGIKAGIEYKGYDTTYSEDYTGHYQFAEDDAPVTLEDGEDAVVVKPYYFYNHPWFEYNEEDGLYYRYQFGDKQVDALTNEQTAVKNIIYQDCDSSVIDEKYGYLDINLTSGGKGKYFTNGKMIDITWSKESETAPTRYFDADGNEITLNQGKTWVCIIQNAYADKCETYSSIEDFEAAK